MWQIKASNCTADLTFVKEKEREGRRGRKEPLTM
jgi:hypothetical protein